MGYFDDIVAPDSASSYFPTPPGVPRITVRPKGVEPPPGPGNAGGLFDDIVPPALSGLFDDIVPPADVPRMRPLAAPVRLVQAPSIAFGDNNEIVERPGQYDEAVPPVPTAEKPAPDLGQDEAIVENSTNPPRTNGAPERPVPLWQPSRIDQNSLGAVASAIGRPKAAAPINPSDASFPDPTSRGSSAPQDRQLAPSLGEYGITEDDPAAANLWKLPPGSTIKAMCDFLAYVGDIYAGRKQLPQTFDPSVAAPAADEAIKHAWTAATLTTGTGAKFRLPRGAYVKNVPAPEAAKPAAEASASGNAPAAEAAMRFGNQQALYNSAVQAFKASDLSNAGRALTKHPEIIGETSATLRQALRTDDAINNAAHAALRDIMRNGVTTIRKLGRFGTVTQIQMPGGFGARWYPDGRFIGFIKPRGV
jgi:hypothetical protein